MAQGSDASGRARDVTVERHQREGRAGIAMPWQVADRHRWGAVLLQTARDLYRSNAPEWAAVVSFYALVSAFPLLLVILIGASWAVDPAWATSKVTALLGAYMPHGGGGVERILQAAVASRGRAGAIALAVLLVSGRRVLGALTKALDLVSDVDERDDPLPRRVAVEALLIVGLTIALVLALVSRPLLELAWTAVAPLPGPANPALQAVELLVRVALLLVVFTLVYAVVPRGKRFWRAAFAGAVVATALFLVAQAAFVLLFDVLWPNLTLVYGPLALAALLLLWGWYIALITLAGGAFASHTKVMILEGRPADEASRAHVR